MNKLILVILAVCLLVGIPLMVMDKLSGASGDFIMPAGYSRIEINLDEKARNNEVVFSSFFNEPKYVDLYIQSDSEDSKFVKVTGDKRFLGKSTNTFSFNIGKITGNSSTGSSFLTSPGNLTISLTSKKAKGKIVIGYREKDVSPSEFERLTKIDGGDLNNPPEGYQEACKVDLSGLSCEDKTIYTLTLDRVRNTGFSIYTNSKRGNVSVDFVGKNTNYIGLVYSNYNAICDQLVQTLGAGDYEIRLTSENADGQLYVFVKQ